MNDLSSCSFSKRIIPIILLYSRDVKKYSDNIALCKTQDQFYISKSININYDRQDYASFFDFYQCAIETLRLNKFVLRDKCTELYVGTWTIVKLSLGLAAGMQRNAKSASLPSRGTPLLLAN